MVISNLDTLKQRSEMRILVAVAVVLKGEKKEIFCLSWVYTPQMCTPSASHLPDALFSCTSHF